MQKSLEVLQIDGEFKPSIGQSSKHLTCTEVVRAGCGIARPEADAKPELAQLC
jgi:hypothetical protein